MSTEYTYKVKYHVGVVGSGSTIFYVQQIQLECDFQAMLIFYRQLITCEFISQVTVEELKK